MSKLEQVIELDPPNELVFRGPFDDIVASKLSLTNPTQQRVCFKVKTTAPRRYCVRPNSGIIEPQSTVSVMLMLQPFEFDPLEKNKHKFMVQTMYAPEGDVNLDVLFKEAAPNQLMDSKLRCVFEMPQTAGGDSQQTGTSDGAVVAASAPSNQSSGDLAPRTPPKSSSIQKTASSDELKKAADEVKNLRSENSNLRQEILYLKEEMVRLRSSASSKSGSSSGAAANIYFQDQNQFTTTHLFVALGVAFFSFILGKWIF